MNILNSLQKTVIGKAKRVGRGYGTGVGGHYSGRGGKGHTSRTGGKIPLWFEGGQLPLIRRLPWWRGKSRFHSLKKIQEVQLKTIVDKKLTVVTQQTLVEAGLARLGYGEPRIISAQEITVALKVEGVAVSGPVKAAIEKAGGSVTL